MARVCPQVSAAAAREARTQVLFARIAADSSESQRRRLLDEVVGLHLPLADNLARRYRGRGVEPEDLLQVARLGLVAAARRYEPGRSSSFAAFAIPTITGELRRYFRDFGWVIRPPRRLQELVPRTAARQREVEQARQRTVTARELSEDLGVPIGLIDECANAWHSYQPVSLDAAQAGGEPLGLHLAELDPEVESVADRISLDRSLAQLSDRDRAILRWRFEEGCSQSVIGQRLGVSQMQASRILARILARTRELLEPEERAAS